MLRLDGNEGGGGRNFDGQSFVTDSIDASVDSSVDRSVDKSIDVDAGEDSRMVTLVNRIIEEAVRNRGFRYSHRADARPRCSSLSH